MNVYKIMEYIYTIFVIVGFAMIGFGAGEVIGTSDTIGAFTDRYRMNVSISDMTKHEGMSYISYTCKEVIGGMSYVFGGLLLIFLSAWLWCSFELEFREKEHKDELFRLKLIISSLKLKSKK